MKNSETILEVLNLSYAYGETQAVSDISFSVLNGEIFSFLGPNGAGKSTVINVLITLLPLQSGRVRVAGFDLQTQRSKVRESIGIVFQNITLDRDMTVRETLEFHAELYAMPSAERSSRIRELLTLVEMHEKADSLIKTLSGGMKRRLEIARGLMTRPKILFLDEPTIGLDPQTRQKTWEYLRSVNQEGTAIFLTTHYMDEADLLSDRISIIDQGRIVISGTPTELKNNLGEDIINLESSDNHAAELILHNNKDLKQIKQYQEKLLISTSTDGARILPQVIYSVHNAGIMVNSVNLKKPTMDDVFIHYTGRQIRD
jgi:ABC-2 type transport system ATP-binding protein